MPLYRLGNCAEWTPLRFIYELFENYFRNCLRIYLNKQPYRLQWKLKFFSVIFVSTCRWYFRKIKRIEAEKKLLLPENEHGAFLIRDSESRHNDYSLSGIYSMLFCNTQISHEMCVGICMSAYARNFPFESLKIILSRWKSLSRKYAFVRISIGNVISNLISCARFSPWRRYGQTLSYPTTGWGWILYRTSHNIQVIRMKQNCFATSITHR